MEWKQTRIAERSILAGKGGVPAEGKVGSFYARKAADFYLGGYGFEPRLFKLSMDLAACRPPRGRQHGP